MCFRAHEPGCCAASEKTPSTGLAPCVVAGSAAGLTAKERRAKRLAEHAAAVRAEVEGDPRMQQLLELFNAKILDVKPLSEPEDA